MKHFKYVLALSLLCCLLKLPALAATNPHISFSARLLCDDGKPLSGFQFATFYIYDNADRTGDALWTETVPVLVGENGEYTAESGTSAAGFAEKVINRHSLLYVSVRTPKCPEVSAATVITTIPQGI